MSDIQSKINDLKTCIYDRKLMLGTLRHDVSMYEYMIQTQNQKQLWVYTRLAKGCRDELAFNLQEIKHLEGLLNAAQDDKYLYYFWDERIF